MSILKENRMQLSEDDMGRIGELLRAGGSILGVRERNGALEFQVCGINNKAQTRTPASLESP